MPTVAPPYETVPTRRATPHRRVGALASAGTIGGRGGVGARGGVAETADPATHEGNWVRTRAAVAKEAGIVTTRVGGHGKGGGIGGGRRGKATEKNKINNAGEGRRRNCGEGETHGTGAARAL